MGGYGWVQGRHINNLNLSDIGKSLQGEEWIRIIAEGMELVFLNIGFDVVGRKKETGMAFSALREEIDTTENTGQRKLGVELKTEC